MPGEHYSDRLKKASRYLKLAKILNASVEQLFSYTEEEQ